MQPGPSDNSLSFTQGSVAGFDSIYEKYHRAVYANILKTVRKPELAEDILQDVFVALWENRANIGYFGEVDHLIPWQIDHQISWRPVAKNAVEALSKLVNKKYNYR